MVICCVNGLGVATGLDDGRIFGNLFSGCVVDKDRCFACRGNNFLNAFSVAVVNGMKRVGAWRA
jgi:hypothetical protein